MMDDDDDDTADFMGPEVSAARDDVGKAIARYLTALRPLEQPYMVAWTAAAEWTNAELEQTGRAGRDTIAPLEQTISASVGLGSFITSQFA